MPFAKRAIEPVRLSRGTLGSEYKFDLDVISNNTLCGLLRQLSSLAAKADCIFSEITEEFVAVVQKTERLRSRVGEVNEHVGRLNAKAVTVRKYNLILGPGKVWTTFQISSTYLCTGTTGGRCIHTERGWLDLLDWPRFCHRLVPLRTQYPRTYVYPQCKLPLSWNAYIFILNEDVYLHCEDRENHWAIPM